MHIGQKVVYEIYKVPFGGGKQMKIFFCTVITLIPSLHYYHFWLPKRYSCFFFRILIFECYLQLSKLFIDILFQTITACKCCTTFNVLLLFFNDRWICAFPLCPRVSVFSKHLAVFTLMNQSCRCCHQEMFCQISVLPMSK